MVGVGVGDRVGGKGGVAGVQLETSATMIQRGKSRLRYKSGVFIIVAIVL